jgi:amidophosphoribosyltransferase
MFDKFHDECGVFGILNHKDAANLVYLGLYALQHRGQESAGIASVSSEATASDTNIGEPVGSSGASELIIAPGTPQIHSEKEMGYVNDIFTESRLARLPGDTAIGHVRYSTAGGSMLCNAQPLVASTSKGPIALAHNGNLVNGADIRARLEADGSIFNTMSDTEVIVHLIARSREATLERALIDALSQVRGAYSIALLAPGRIYAARDPYGFRPLVVGRLDDALVISSETCAFDLIGAKTIREIRAGEIVVIECAPSPGASRHPLPAGEGRPQAGVTTIHPLPVGEGRPQAGVTTIHPLSVGEGRPQAGVRVVHQFTSNREARCIFEHVYFARPDSVIFGNNVAEVRKRFGAQLARDHGVDADVVVPVPDSGVFAALGYAQESGIPFEYGLVRNHYVGRTFIEPSQSIRDFGVKVKLNAVQELVGGKRVVLIDDSIVRGTTSRKIVRMLKNAGASEVHMRISSPPTTGPCFYGIDTPQRRDLIAASNSIEEIRGYIDADSVGYLSEEAMLAAMREENARELYCTACFSGRYPVVREEAEAAAAIV